MYKFKAIKPGPYRDDAVSAHVGDRMRLLGDFIKESYDRVTSGWTGERPEWMVKYQAGATWIQLSIVPANPESEGSMKWLWLDEGTEGPYPIPKDPNAKGPLFFMSEYSAGSSVGSLTTYKASSSGSLVSAKQVMHPGIAARGWSELLQTEWEDKSAIWAADAMKEAAKLSGHAKE